MTKLVNFYIRKFINSKALVPVYKLCNLCKKKNQICSCPSKDKVDLSILPTYFNLFVQIPYTIYVHLCHIYITCLDVKKHCEETRFSESSP